MCFNVLCIQVSCVAIPTCGAVEILYCVPDVVVAFWLTELVLHMLLGLFNHAIKRHNGSVC